jgi:hypothetical protein
MKLDSITAAILGVVLLAAVAAPSDPALPAAQSTDFSVKVEGATVTYSWPSPNGRISFVTGTGQTPDEWGLVKLGRQTVGMVPVDSVGMLPGSQAPNYTPAEVGLWFAFQVPNVPGFNTCFEVYITAVGWTPESAIEHIHAKSRVYINAGYEQVGAHCPAADPF